MSETLPAVQVQTCQRCAHPVDRHRATDPSRCEHRTRTGIPIHAGGHGISEKWCTCPAFIAAPGEPVDETADCLHCAGTGVVDDEFELNGQMVGAEFCCDRCEGHGTAPVDADGRCACDDCLRLPVDQRLLTEAALAEHEATQTTTQPATKEPTP